MGVPDLCVAAPTQLLAKRQAISRPAPATGIAAWLAVKPVPFVFPFLVSWIPESILPWLDLPAHFLSILEL